MINELDAERAHNTVLEIFGGSKGIRDRGSLLAALARPYATFDQQDLYPAPIEKAAAIFESIIINHPFMDGNKRTAYILMRMTLIDYDLDIMAFEDEKYEMTIAASEGKIRIDEITLWIKERLVTITQ